jgi:two-component system cell cycle sensor histidine kinase/response regulator CckA
VKRRVVALEGQLESAHRELADSRARLQATFDSALDAIVTIDDSSVIREWNRHAEVLFGWSREEAIGRRLQDTIIPTRYRDQHVAGVHRFLASGEGPILNRRIEIEALRRDGTEVPVELTVTPATSGDHTVFSAFVRDLTERRRVEAERTLKQALTHVLSESRTLSEAAPKALEAIGSALEWHLGAFWVLDTEANVLRPEAVWVAAEHVAPEFVSATRSRTFEKGIGLPGRVWEQGGPTWIANVEGHANFPRGPIASRAGLQSAFGFPVLSGAEFLGVIEFFHTEIREPDDALLATVDVIGRDFAQAMKRLRAEDERDRALVALRERTREAEAANQAKSIFLTNMSHELRTPINAIIGYAELVEMGISGPLTDAQASQMRRIRASSRHLVQLIEEILDFSKIEAGKMRVERRTARLKAPVRAACDLIEGQAEEKGVRLEKGCATDDLRFTGDEDRVVRSSSTCCPTP